jgi:hypothetical protein
MVTGSQSHRQHPHPCAFHMLCTLPAVFDTNNDGMKGNSRLLCVSGDTSQTETQAKRKPFAVPIPTARYGGIAAAQKNLNLCLEDLDGEALEEARGPAVVGEPSAALRGFLSLATPRNVHAAFIAERSGAAIPQTLLDTTGRLCCNYLLPCTRVCVDLVCAIEFASHLLI